MFLPVLLGLFYLSMLEFQGRLGFNHFKFKIPGGGGVETLLQKGRGCSSHLLGVKKAPVLVPLKVFSLRRFTAGAIAVSFKLL